jgi:hypothetical protein
MTSRKRRERQKVAPAKAAPNARDNKTRSRHVNVSRRLSEASDTARDRALHVLADLRRDPALTFTQAAKNRNVDRGTARKYLRSTLRRNNSGRIKAKPSDRLRVILQIPSTKPGEHIPVSTKSSQERKLVGQWHAALNAASQGDLSLISQFPRGQMVGGVLLPTGLFQIQKILAAQAETETKLEGPYRTLARPA